VLRVSYRISAMVDDEIDITVSVSEDESLTDQPTTPTERLVKEPASDEYWWYQPAKPPVLVNLCSGEECDININDNENISSLSYWSLPFPKKAFRENKGFHLRRMLWKYKTYILNDPERLNYLPGLSGLRLGYQRVHTTPRPVLIQLFEELKITRRDVYMCQHYYGTMPTTLRPEEMEKLRRYNDRHRQWPQYSEDTVRKKRHRRPSRTYRRTPRWRHDHASETRCAYIPEGMEKMNYKQYVDSYMRNVTSKLH